MKQMKFDDSWELAEYIDELYGTVDIDGGVIAVGNSEFAKTLLQDLIILGHDIGIIIELEDADVSGYTDEYYVELDRFGVCVEKAYDVNKKRYRSTSGDYILVNDDCNSAILKNLSGNMFELSISEKKDETGSEDDASQHKCDCKCQKVPANDVTIDAEYLLSSIRAMQQAIERLLI